MSGITDSYLETFQEELDKANEIFLKFNKLQQTIQTQQADNERLREQIETLLNASDPPPKEMIQSDLKGPAFDRQTIITLRETVDVQRRLAESHFEELAKAQMAVQELERQQQIDRQDLDSAETELEALKLQAFKSSPQLILAEEKVEQLTLKAKSEKEQFEVLKEQNDTLNEQLRESELAYQQLKKKLETPYNRILKMTVSNPWYFMLVDDDTDDEAGYVDLAEDDQQYALIVPDVPEDIYGVVKSFNHHKLLDHGTASPAKMIEFLHDIQRSCDLPVKEITGKSLGGIADEIIKAIERYKRDKDFFVQRLNDQIRPISERTSFRNQFSIHSLRNMLVEYGKSNRVAITIDPR